MMNYDEALVSMVKRGYCYANEETLWLTEAGVQLYREAIRGVPSDVVNPEEELDSGLAKLFCTLPMFKDFDPGEVILLIAAYRISVTQRALYDGSHRLTYDGLVDD